MPTNSSLPAMAALLLCVCVCVCRAPRHVHRGLKLWTPTKAVGSPPTRDRQTVRRIVSSGLFRRPGTSNKQGL